MTLPPLPLPAYVLVVPVLFLYAVALWAMGVYTPRDVRHWERLAVLRGLQGSVKLSQRVGGRLPLLGRIRAEVDIGLLLVVSGSTQSSESWLVGSAAWALGGGACTAAFQALGLAFGAGLPIPLWVSLAVIPTLLLTRYMRLRRLARHRQARVGEELADALLGLALLVPAIPPEDAMGMLARCQRDGALADVLDERRVVQLLGEGAALRSTRERYWLIGRALGVPLFQELSLVMRGIETEGLSPQEEYPALSRMSAETRLAQNRLRAARAKTGAAAAVALLLIPLLIMVGGGIAFAFLGSVNG